MSGQCRCRPEHDELSVRCVRLLHDPEGQKSKHAGVRPVLYEILDNAQRSIVLQSPYIIPGQELGEILRRAARRGVCVRILTNSLPSTNRVLAYSAFSREAPECARAGVRFWEYGGPKCLHAKSFVVDGRIACIASFNFDSRSEKLNTELATLVCDEVFATELLAAMDRNFCEAYPMRLEGRELVSSPELEAADPARTRQSRVYGSVWNVNRLPGLSRVSEPGLRFLQGLSRLIQRQL
jgi:phosphatidylserine/phosphatidylglycerophosphate/cardiolipin synthase-like enzyme